MLVFSYLQIIFCFREGIQVVVIELNPFDKWTSGALFDWEIDKEILHGNSPFEFRLHAELQYLFFLNLFF